MHPYYWKLGISKFSSNGDENKFHPVKFDSPAKPDIEPPMEMPVTPNGPNSPNLEGLALSHS